MKKTLLAIVFASLSLSRAFAASDIAMGTLNVTVVDENGALVQDAPVYIYGEHKTKFVGGKEIPGTTTLTMPAGSYKISSALMKRTGDYFDRYASHEAHIDVVPGDNAVVVLTLKPIQDAFASMDVADMKKIGVPADIARNF